MVLDVAAYNKDIAVRRRPAAWSASRSDPAQNATTDFRILTNPDFGNTRGIDVRLDRRFGNFFNGTLAYTFQQAKNTGSDPFTYLDFGSRIVNQLGGGNAPPPAGDPAHRRQPAAHAGVRRQPDFPATGSRARRSARSSGTSACSSTFRYTSGTAYTGCVNTGRTACSSRSTPPPAVPAPAALPRGLQQPPAARAQGARCPLHQGLRRWAGWT